MRLGPPAYTVRFPLTVVGDCDGLVDGAELGLPLGVWEMGWVKSSHAIADRKLDAGQEPGLHRPSSSYRGWALRGAG